jgi:hypothetical protein
VGKLKVPEDCTENLLVYFDVIACFSEDKSCKFAYFFCDSQGNAEYFPRVHDIRMSFTGKYLAIIEWLSNHYYISLWSAATKTESWHV